MHYVTLSILSLFTLCLGTIFAEETPVVKLPAKIERIVQSAKSNILKEYQGEIAKLVKELEKSKIQATKAGNLKDANILDNLIKEVSADSLLAEILTDSKIDGSVDLLGNSSNPISNEKSKIIGKWSRNNFIVEIKKDGTFVDSRNISGIWGCNSDGSFFMTWDDSKVTINCSKPDKNFSQESGSSNNKMERIVK